MNFGVLVFPGSNCDDDMMHVLGDVMNCNVQKIWHKESSLDKYGKLDCIVIPGGFSYGDYLRSGAIARYSPIMKAVTQFANNGGYVLGICNGFQVLTEAQLLPGALLRNEKQKFICKNIYLKNETENSALTSEIKKGDVLKIPIAHADGRYFINAEGHQKLVDNDQILFSYCDDKGNKTPDSNINGSINHIAGICNESRNVFGMMPHPERASESLLGNIDGRAMFESLIKNMN